MRTNNIMIRQSMGCPYEAPASASIMVQPWEPARSECGFFGDVTMCPGYTTTLPEVLEVDRIRPHWKVGALRDACDGEQPTEQLMRMIDEIDVQYNAAENYWRTPAKDGGGGQ